MDDDWREICWQEPLEQVTKLLPPRPSSQIDKETTVQSNHAATIIKGEEEQTKKKGAEQKEKVVDGPAPSNKNVDLSLNSTIINRTENMSGDKTVAKVCRKQTDEIGCEQLKKDLPPQPPPPPHSITERLPENSFYRDPPNLYIFPGAEIWWDDSSDSDNTTNRDESNGSSSSNCDTNSQPGGDSDTNSEHDEDDGGVESNHDCSTKSRIDKQSSIDSSNPITFGHQFLTSSDHTMKKLSPPLNISTNKRKSNEVFVNNCSTTSKENVNIETQANPSSSNHKKRKFTENV